MDDQRVLGVDATKDGWVAVALVAGRTAAYFAPTIAELVARADAAAPVAVVAIDIPIGLPDASPRQADLRARDKIGRLRSSVFMTPVRSAFDAPDHGSAVEINRRLSEVGVSIQAFGLRTKVLQVDRWIRQTGHRVVEVHPEVSFAELAGAPLQVRKSTWAGAQRRRHLLADADVTLHGDLGEAGQHAAVDDVLDAAVAAWTAQRVADGHAYSLPDPPERFSDGIPCAIWV